MESLLALIVLFGLLGLYLLPTIIASRRNHQVGFVAVLNIFLGWTFLGWIVALAISVGDRKQPSSKD